MRFFFQKINDCARFKCRMDLFFFIPSVVFYMYPFMCSSDYAFMIKQLLSVSSVMYLETTLGKKMQDKGINHCLSIKNNKNNPMSFPAASSWC